MKIHWFTMLWQIFNLACIGLIIGGIFYLCCLMAKALRKYIGSSDQRQAQAVVRQSLGEVIRSHRTRCGMTQELVAERLGVSRQAVSKWESGASEPSTSNLLALADLFGILPEELLREVAHEEKNR